MTHPNQYRPDIDGLRAVAIAGVVAYHFFPGAAPGGFVGVDVFFVISGYLITHVITEGRHAGTFTLRGFYRRRAIRLFPALAAMLGSFLIAGWWLLDPADYRQLGIDAAAAAAYISNFVFAGDSGYFQRPASLRPLTHLWSLAVEEQFYLLYPVALLAALRMNRPRVVIAVGIAASFAVNLAWAGSPNGFYLLPGRFWELLVGALLAVAAPTVRRWPARVLSSSGVAGIVVAFFVVPQASFPGWWATLPVLSAAAMIAAPTGPANRLLLERSPLVFIGLISYPLYLWHFPLLVFARLHGGEPTVAARLLLIALSMVLAYVTYRFIETPVRRRRAARTWRPLVAVTIALVVAGSAGIAVVSAAGFPGRVPYNVRKLVDYKYDYRAGFREGTCFLRPEQDASQFGANCVDKGHGKLLFVWGDSHAAMLYPGLRQLATKDGFRLAQFTASSCPPLLPYVAGPVCHGINQEAFRRLQQLKPDAVLLCDLWDPKSYGPPSEIVQTVAAIRSAGVQRIVIVGPVPEWWGGLPLALYQAYQAAPSRGLPERMTHALLNESVLDGQVRQAAIASHAAYASPWNALCNRKGCLTRVGDQLPDLVQWDSTHLTAAGAKYVVARIQKAITATVNG